MFSLTMLVETQTAGYSLLISLLQLNLTEW